MPTWTNGNTAAPSDDSLRSLEKICQQWYDLKGDQPSPYPEGCAPVPGDDKARLLAKITILKEA